MKPDSNGLPAASQPPTVKICGIRTEDTLQQMQDLAVDHIGFVFAPSRRQISVSEAARLVDFLDKNGLRNESMFRTAGVFVNADMDKLAEVLAAVPLDIVQLHGQETPAYCREVKSTYAVDIFKAIPIPESGMDSAAAVAELLHSLEPYVPYVDAFLVDTYEPAVGGGSGRTFSWDVLPPIRQWVRSVKRKLIVAGGLHADNVARLLQQYCPDGVDVSSGVETDGVKDTSKIREFVERVKQR